MSLHKNREWIGLLLITLIASSFLLFATSQNRYKEDDSSFFALVIQLIPATVFLASKEPFLVRFFRATWFIFYWLIFYALYRDYRNHPWFAVAPALGCDGPCWGWYSFENFPIYAELLIVGFKSLSVGGLFYLLFIGMRRLRNGKVKLGLGGQK